MNFPELIKIHRDKCPATKCARCRALNRRYAATHFIRTQTPPPPLNRVKHACALSAEQVGHKFWAERTQHTHTHKKCYTNYIADQLKLEMV